MDKIIQKADAMLDEWEDAFISKNWTRVNILKRELRAMIDNYYNRLK